VEIDDFYDFMMEWKQNFPSDAKNASLSYQDIDAATLKQARKQASVDFNHQR
jgi:hypothetical protein